MASSVDYVFDPYVVDGYAPSDYVQDPYLADDYVSQATLGSASLTSSSSVSAQGGFLKQSTATLTSQASVSTSATITRSSTASLASQATQSASATITRTDSATITAQATQSTAAVVKRDGTSSSSSVFSCQTAGVQTKRSSLSISGAWNASIFAVATVSPGADFGVSATLSGDSKITRTSSATLNAGTIEVYWGDDNTWNDPYGIIWGPGLVASAIRQVGGDLTYNLTCNSTLSADGDVTAVGELTVDNFASVSSSAIKIVNASATLDSQFSTDAVGNVARDVVNFVMTSQASVSAKGIFQVAGHPGVMEVQATQTTDAVKTARSPATLAAQATQAQQGNRIRFGVTEITAQFSETVNGDRVASGIVLQASAGTLQADGKQTKGPYQLELSGVFTQSCNGGRLRNGSATFNALNSVLSALTIFNIDPYRVYTVPIESRIAVIDQDTRIFALNSENRLNTINNESRQHEVGSESRYLVIQPLRLVELAGTLDRREG